MEFSSPPIAPAFELCKFSGGLHRGLTNPTASSLVPDTEMCLPLNLLERERNPVFLWLPMLDSPLRGAFAAYRVFKNSEISIFAHCPVRAWLRNSSSIEWWSFAANDGLYPPFTNTLTIHHFSQLVVARPQIVVPPPSHPPLQLSTRLNCVYRINVHNVHRLGVFRGICLPMP